MVILKLAGRVLLVPLWFIISIIGAGVKLLVHLVTISKKILGLGILALDTVIDLLREKICTLILG